ncbi:hypothetical protein GCM10018954_030190 [Kutzneria kofuensis]
MRGIAGPLTKLIIFMVITVLATSLLALTIANIDLRSASDYSARFSDVTSLNVGDDVRIAGVRVGSVDGIQVVDRRQAQVSFSIDGGHKLPASVTATIKYRNLVGQRYIALEPGAGDPNAVLPAGGTIPLDHTKPALDLTVLFNGFKPLFQALSPDDVNKLSYEIIQVLQGEGGTIDSLLAHTASLTSTIADKDQVIGQVIDNLNSVLDTVNAHGDQLSTLISQLQQLVTGFAQERKPIGDSIAALGDLADSTAGLLQQGRQPLKDDIAQLGSLSKNLGDNDLLNQFLQTLPGKVETITRTATYGSWFNFFLCSASGTVAAADHLPGDAARRAGDPGEVQGVKPFRERNPIAIGAIGLTVIALLMLAAFFADDLPIIGGGTTYSADFSEAAGLVPGNEVRIAGVKVGKVRSVGLDGDHVKVDFRWTTRGSATRPRPHQDQDVAGPEVPVAGPAGHEGARPRHRPSRATTRWPLRRQRGLQRPGHHRRPGGHQPAGAELHRAVADLRQHAAGRADRAGRSVRAVQDDLLARPAAGAAAEQHQPDHQDDLGPGQGVPDPALRRQPFAAGAQEPERTPSASCSPAPRTCPRSCPAWSTTTRPSCSRRCSNWTR